jgi:REP element-mobilizing transposase RayT
MSAPSLPHPSGTRRTRVGRASLPGQIYHVVASTSNRRPIFLDLACARQLVITLRCLELDAATLAFVIMPDHLHWLVQLTGSRTMSSVVRTMKSLSAYRIGKFNGEQGVVWQAGFFDRAIRRDEDVKAVARYIVANPLRGGLVKSLKEYPHWYAIWA